MNRGRSFSWDCRTFRNADLIPGSIYVVPEDIDEDSVDQAAPALLVNGPPREPSEGRAFDWDASGPLHRKGYISDPIGKTKLVVFTDEGLREWERLPHVNVSSAHED
jgi:hypothetical protein